MPVIRRVGDALTKIAFGDTLIPQEFTVGLRDPQTEIAVWLDGLDEPIDVTRRLCTACCAPLILAVSLEEGRWADRIDRRKISLKFCEHEGRKRSLGEIHLRLKALIPLRNSELVLFEATGSTNHCLPRPRLWSHHLSQAYVTWRTGHTWDVKMTVTDQFAAMVTFIRPHPISLVSIVGEAGGNIFPMNLMGDLGHGYFAFGLKDSRMAAHLVERTGRIALSNVPMPLCPLAYQFAIHHTKQSIEWDQIPFALKPSKTFHIPVPALAPRVRELEVDQLHRLGSHTFFIARIVSDERFSNDLQANVIHGFYQYWRVRGRKEELKASVAADFLNKHGVAAS
jgi:flavin reductase (DIM6/NTAB) family NADH-FMN oxidoreductase RutF